MSFTDPAELSKPPIRKSINILSPKAVQWLAKPSLSTLVNLVRSLLTRKRLPLRFSKIGINNMARPANLICEVRFGSHLYGTNTETSDEDYKGIFLPSVEDILLGRIPKTANSSANDSSRKNLPGELDCSYYSLHHFLHLAMQGQTVAIDMLFAPENMVYLDAQNGWIWKELQKNRHLLLSKDMNAFVGYCRAQANKYSLKGERLNLLLKAREVIVQYGSKHLFIEAIPSLTNANCISEVRTNPQNVKEYQISGKWFSETTEIFHVLTSLHNSMDKYGTRSHDASEADGVDWKAMSHAVRVSKELIEIICFGKVTFPLTDANLILRIKKGEVPLVDVQNILDRDLAFIELKTPQSLLPDHVDRLYWEKWLYNTIMSKIIHFEGLK